jgi:uncharacterized protein (DUF952 family)
VHDRPSRPALLIFHIALTREWEAARLTGEYRVSTLGATLEQVGYIHASNRDQVERIGAFVYATVSEPLTVLQIDTRRLAAPVRLENTEGGSELFPHIYGPIDVDAVTATLRAHSDGQRFVVDWG